MAEDRPRSVKDVSADAFIRAFAAYLKQTNKVCKASVARIWAQPAPKAVLRRMMEHAGRSRPPGAGHLAHLRLDNH